MSGQLEGLSEGNGTITAEESLRAAGEEDESDCSLGLDTPVPPPLADDQSAEKTKFEDGQNNDHQNKKGLIHKGSSLLAEVAEHHIAMPLYRHPRQRQRWGDTQVHPVKEWGTFL
jgi:hypothetical protein